MRSATIASQDVANEQNVTAPATVWVFRALPGSLHDGRVRAVRIALAGLLGLVGALIGAPAAFAAGANITLDPAHGAARTTMTVTYRYSIAGAGFCPVGRTRVVFAWDGNAVDQSQLNRQTCSARVRLRPPRADNDPGQHRVTAVIPAIFGSQADSVYTIDGGAPSPTTVRGDQTGGPTGAATTAPPATDTSPAVDSPAPAAGGTVAGSATTATAANVQPAWMGWALVFGALLVLAGAGTLGMVIVRSRRERAEY
ncbi:MAG: hypothetical protein V7603_3441 [Micromonosporaceae bacterium]